MLSNFTTSPPAPLVSVIVPTYNYGHLISQTLASLLAQTYPHWECIVVDDGSTDNTREVVAHYATTDSRFKYVRQSNQRQAAAKNTGIKISGGEYLQFLDADDLLETKKLERQVEYLEQRTEVDIVYGDARYFRTESMEERVYSMWGDNRPWMPYISGRGKEILLALIRNNIMVIHAPLIRKRVVETIGLFDENLPLAEDWDYLLRCAAEGKEFRYENLEGTLALVRSHPSSSSRNMRLYLTAKLRMRRKVRTLTTDPDVLRLNAQLVAEDEGTLGVEEVMCGALTRGVYQFCRAGIADKRLKYKARWFLCAFISPFVSKQHFKAIFSSSLTKSAVNMLPSLTSDGRR